MKKNESGITLIALVIMIIILSILATVFISTGSDSYEEMKLQAFYAEMQIIQQRVNVISTQIANGDTNYDSIISSATTTPEQIALLNTLIESGDIIGDVNSFKAYDRQALVQLDITGIDQTVLINFDTREIVSVVGITVKGVTYHTL